MGGQFINLDPREILNRYRYVYSNPTNLVDPSGLCASAMYLSKEADIDCIERWGGGEGGGPELLYNTYSGGASDPATRGNQGPINYPSNPSYYGPAEPNGTGAIPDSAPSSPLDTSSLLGPYSGLIPVGQGNNQAAGQRNPAALGQSSAVPLPLPQPFELPELLKKHDTCYKTKQKEQKCDQQAVLAWIAANPGKQENNFSAPEYDYQRHYCGLKYEIKNAAGVKAIADGIRVEDCYILDAKFVEDADHSLYVLGSKKRTDPKARFLAEIADAEQADLFYRYAQLINAPELPFVGLEVITNEPKSASYWNFWITVNEVPGGRIRLASWPA